MFAILLAASAMFVEPPAQEPEATCAVTRSTVFVHRFADLPAAIREDILQEAPIAEAGQLFTEYDVVYDPSLPHRRFVLAGVSDGRWFVWIDQGGFARYHRVLGYHPVYSGTDPTPTLRLAADFVGSRARRSTPSCAAS